MPDRHRRVRIRPVARTDPDLRRLARAFIALAAEQNTRASAEADHQDDTDDTDGPDRAGP